MANLLENNCCSMLYPAKSTECKFNIHSPFVSVFSLHLLQEISGFREKALFTIIIIIIKTKNKE